MNFCLLLSLRKSTILEETQYRPDNFAKSLIPIIPSQEVPEFNNLIPDLPYIIYDYEVEGYGDQWWICEEIMKNTIWYSIFVRK